MDSIVEGMARGVAEAAPRRAIIVATRTGGQGKSLIAHLLAAELRRLDPDYRVLCADSLEVIERGKPGVSKLGRAVLGTIEIGPGPSAAELQANPQLASEYWDTIASLMVDCTGAGLLIDVGANVIDAILEWAALADLAAVLDGAVAVDLVVPVVATAKSIADARDVIQRARQSGGFPLQTVTLVENCWLGPFGGLAQDTDYRALHRLVREAQGQVVVMPRCGSEILNMVERSHRFLGDVGGWDFPRVAEAFGWSAVKASRETKMFRQWLEACRLAFGEAGLTSPYLPAGKAVVDGRKQRDQRPA